VAAIACLFVCCILPVSVRAATITAASCSQADVQEAVDLAETGDSVYVPAGSATWSSAVTVSKAISIIGAGVGSTILTGSGSMTSGFFFVTNVTSTQLLRISGFRFTCPTTGDYAIRIETAVDLSQLRIDHNRFDFSDTAQIFVTGCRGVIDHNDFYNGVKAVSFSAGSAAQQTASWASMAAGTGEALFIETNNIIDDANYPHASTQEKIGTFGGGKLVMRYNTFDFDDMALPENSHPCHPFGAHGSAKGGAAGSGYWQEGRGARRGQSVIEYYYNTISGRRIDFMYSSRGSANLVHHNAVTVSTAWKPRIYFNEEEQYEASNWSPLRTAWPAEDQIHNSFIWANTFNGTAYFNDIGHIAIPHASSAGYIQQNRDFWFHEPQASGGSESFTGQNGASNTYPTDGTTLPTLGTMTFSPEGPNAYYPYTPYVYPHPLQTSSSSPVFYVREGALGNGTGSNWINAFNTLPATLLRGATYYIADGNYSSYTIDDPVFGAQSITIKKATQLDHGTDTGWQTNMGDGVAAFSGITFGTSHLVLDGGKRDSPIAGYGLKIASTTDQATLITVNGAQTNITIRYCELSGDSTLVNRTTGIYAVQNPSSLTVQYCYLHDMFGVPFHLIGATKTLVEHSVIARNKSTPEWHSEGMQCRGGVDLTIRYNVWEDMQGTGVIVSGSGDSSQWYVYGNIFNRYSVGHGAVADNMNGTIHDVYIYNNIFKDGENGGLNFWNGTGNIHVANNIWYSTGWATFTGVTDRDYNYFSNAKFPYAFNPQANETPVRDGGDGKYSTITDDPFVDSVAGDFRLKVPLAGYSGLSLTSPYDKDVVGNTRGADGVWDRGVFEFISGVTSPDSDGDELIDSWEIQYFGSISDSRALPELDVDGDGLSNLFEQTAGTSPIDSKSVLRVINQSLSELLGFTITWQSVSNKTYSVESSTTLSNWTPAAWVDATSPSTSWTDAAPSGAKKFYRVKIQ
jgi:hypothetical protein